MPALFALGSTKIPAAASLFAGKGGKKSHLYQGGARVPGPVPGCRARGGRGGTGVAAVVAGARAAPKTRCRGRGAAGMERFWRGVGGGRARNYPAVNICQLGYCGLGRVFFIIIIIIKRERIEGQERGLGPGILQAGASLSHGLLCQRSLPVLPVLPVLPEMLCHRVLSPPLGQGSGSAPPCSTVP